MIEAAAQGSIDLCYFDESGFAPTMPTGYTWAPRKVRPVVPYEAPQGRRLNVLGALWPDPTLPQFAYQSTLGKVDGALVLEFLWRQVARLPAPPEQLPFGYRRRRPCVVVLDNASAHCCRLVRDAVPLLERVGVYLFYLPPYSPELDLIEPVWRQVKYHELPVRSYQTGAALKEAVDGVLEQRVHQPEIYTMNFSQTA